MKYTFAALAAAAILLPGLARAADGHVTCQAYSAAKNKVWYTQAFAANKADTDDLYEKFVKYLADNSYTTSMYSSEPSPVQGICNWESSAADANSKTSGFKANYEAKGASTMGVGFSADE